MSTEREIVEYLDPEWSGRFRCASDAAEFYRLHAPAEWTQAERELADDPPSERDAIGELATRLAADMPPEHQQIIDTASNHPYGCMCQTCLSWWALIGPDGGDPGDYGPFTKEQVNAEQVRMGVEVTP